MNARLDKLLCKKFPTLFASRHADMRSTAMCWGFECGDGWYRIIKEAAEELEPLMAEYRSKDPEGWAFGYYRATQVKEKFGTLRIYMAGYNDKIDTIIRKAARASAKTCETCGKPGKLRGTMWVYTACKKHVQELG